MHPELIPLHVVLMRGGTSKAIFLKEEQLPADPEQRDRLILALYGSPDRRQIDGLGGADILTSKLAIIGPPSRPDADVDYTFGQVGIDKAYVSYDINCGNISSAVGVYAIEEGYVPATEPITQVRIHNTNTRKILVAHVPVKAGYPQVEGEFQIDGVPGTGAEIGLDYSQTVGSATAALFPTGKIQDAIYLPSLGRAVVVTVLDLANLCLFYPGEELGLSATMEPDDFTEEMIQRIEELRLETIRTFHFKENPLTPFPVAVFPPASYAGYTSQNMVVAEEMDLCVKLATRVGVHKAYPGTVGACTAAAARIPGTIVHRIARRETGGQEVIRLGHPSGILPVKVRVKGLSDPVQIEQLQVEKVLYSRTARRLLAGTAYVRRSRL